MAQLKNEKDLHVYDKDGPGGDWTRSVPTRADWVAYKEARGIPKRISSGLKNKIMREGVSLGERFVEYYSEIEDGGNEYDASEKLALDISTYIVCFEEYWKKNPKEANKLRNKEYWQSRYKVWSTKLSPVEIMVGDLRTLNKSLASSFLSNNDLIHKTNKIMHSDVVMSVQKEIENIAKEIQEKVIPCNLNGVDERAKWQYVLANAVESYYRAENDVPGGAEFHHMTMQSLCLNAAATLAGRAGQCQDLNCVLALRVKDAIPKATVIYCRMEEPLSHVFVLFRDHRDGKCYYADAWTVPAGCIEIDINLYHHWLRIMYEGGSYKQIQAFEGGYKKEIKRVQKGCLDALKWNNVEGDQNDNRLLPIETIETAKKLPWYDVHKPDLLTSRKDPTIHNVVTQKPWTPENLLKEVETKLPMAVIEDYDGPYEESLPPLPTGGDELDEETQKKITKSYKYWEEMSAMYLEGEELKAEIKNQLYNEFPKDLVDIFLKNLNESSLLSTDIDLHGYGGSDDLKSRIRISERKLYRMKREEKNLVNQRLVLERELATLRRQLATSSGGRYQHTNHTRGSARSPHRSVKSRQVARNDDKGREVWT